jgi:hypothetical protein
MDLAPVWRERDDALGSLGSPNLDFGGAYVACGQLEYLAEQHPEHIGNAPAAALCALLREARHQDQRQCFFLYRKAARALCHLVTARRDPALSRMAFSTLGEVVCERTGPLQKAAAEVMGCLPARVPAPGPPPAWPGGPAPVADATTVLGLGGAKKSARGYFLGRSHVTPLSGGEGFVVVKLAREEEGAENLFSEAGWMEKTAGIAQNCPGVFRVPRPLLPGGAPVFRLKDAPGAGAAPQGLHPERLAMAFVAPPGYFDYPNEPDSLSPVPGESVLQCLENAALVLGWLAGQGIVHTAPIPLFHNRVQRERRNDAGLYEWQRGGRLDRWLTSCRHPNFGATGARDFEHFAPRPGPAKDLYLALGKHVLSLLLVAGSCFRMADPGRAGLEPDGEPVDARDLFDPALLARMARGIIHSYHRGFSGRPFPSDLRLDFGILVQAMIDKMGVDRNMEEILRAHDQERMSPEEFRAFLAERGVAGKKEKGKADIVMLTGPHLGQFAGRISLPEILDATAAAAALCVAGRYRARDGERLPH